MFCDEEPNFGVIRANFEMKGNSNHFPFIPQLLFIFSFLYIISPFDLLPESFLGIVGLFDDIFVILCTGCFNVTDRDSLITVSSDGTDRVFRTGPAGPC